MHEGLKCGSETARKRGGGCVPSGAMRAGGGGEHGECEAERLDCNGFAVMGMDGVPLKELRKGEAGKPALATLVRTPTGVGNAWVVKRLHMGQDRSMSRLIRHGAEDVAVAKWLGNSMECYHATLAMPLTIDQRKRISGIGLLPLQHIDLICIFQNQTYLIPEIVSYMWRNQTKAFFRQSSCESKSESH